MPVTDMFWGDRHGNFLDPFGHSWEWSTHTEDLSEEEMEKRAQAFYAEMEQKQKKSLKRKLFSRKGNKANREVCRENLCDLLRFSCVLRVKSVFTRSGRFSGVGDFAKRNAKMQDFLCKLRGLLVPFCGLKAFALSDFFCFCSISA